MKSILFYSDTYLPRSETFVYNRNRHIKNYKVIVLAHDYKNQEEFPLPEAQFETIPRASTSFLSKAGNTIKNKLLYQTDASDLISVAQLKPIIEKHSIELIVAHFCSNGIKIMDAAETLNVPLVALAYGCDVTSWCRFERYEKNLKKLFQKSAQLVPCSEYLKKRVLALGCPSDKITVTHLPLKDTAAHSQPTKGDQAKDVVTILHCGRLVKKKGILHLIRAFHQAQKAVPKLRLKVIGEGYLSDEAKALSRELKLDAYITFIGAVTHSEAIEAQLAADIFALHSITDDDGDTEGGTTTVIPEAMLAGCPIVSTRHADIPYVVRDNVNGFTTEEKDEAATAQAFITLGKDSELRQKMGNASRALLEELELTPDAINRSFESIIETAIQNNNK